jgi:hypothetical protein
MSNEEEIEYYAKERRAIVEEQALIKTALDEVNNKLLELVPDDGYVTDDEKIVVVKPNTKLEYDWDAIKELLGPDLWDSIQVRSPSPEKLEQVIAQGGVSITDVSKATIERPGARPYVKVTKKKK